MGVRSGGASPYGGIRQPARGVDLIVDYVWVAPEQALSPHSRKPDFHPEGGQPRYGSASTIPFHSRACTVVRTNTTAASG
jgi:hypothetical protein